MVVVIKSSQVIPRFSVVSMNCSYYRKVDDLGDCQVFVETDSATDFEIHLDLISYFSCSDDD